jgi:epoxyqueuosine reductase
VSPDAPLPDERSLRDRIEARARALGFDAIGFARADEPLTSDHERYVDFVAAGKHGTMGYLAESVEARRRLDTADVLEGARTVICLARRYQRGDDELDPPVARLIARYARGQDYHNHLRKKVRALAKFVRTLAPDVRARPLLDEEPILERAWAARSGLGFVGKNGLVIVPGQGSFVLLGEVVTTLVLPPLTPMTERCGSCTRCLEACPTQAFDAPFVLDPRRCIAYLTIEAPLVEGPDVGEHLFGCDDCQTVCPFNRAPLRSSNDPRPFRPLPVWGQTSLEDLAELDEPRFAALTVGSPLHRAGRLGLARSASRVLSARARPPRGDAS